MKKMMQGAALRASAADAVSASRASTRAASAAESAAPAASATLRPAPSLPVSVTAATRGSAIIAPTRSLRTARFWNSPAGAPPAEDAIPMRRIFAFIAMVFGMFMAILDIQIVSASLTDIQAGLSASADEIPWVQTSYLVAEVIMIPLSGYLSRMISTRSTVSISECR